jgi:hypothetical protein
MIRFGVDDILNTTELIDSQGNIDYNRITATADMALCFLLPLENFCSSTIWE